jgi:hypothetical protein
MNPAAALAPRALPHGGDPAGELHGVLDRLGAADFTGWDAGAQEQLLGSLARAEARVSALRLRLLQAAEHSRAAARSGAASTGQWAARVVNGDQATAQRQVGLAHGLARRTATQEALGSGVISVEHAQVIVRADRELPAALDADRRAVVERRLIEKARVLSPGALRRVARRALAAVEADVAAVDAHENQVVAAEEERARARTRFTLHENGDGTVTGHFTVPALHGELLRKILQTMTAPRRGRFGAGAAQLGDAESRTDWDRARGEAFCELVEHLPTEHLHPRTAATVVVTIADDVLRDALRAAHLDTGGVVSAGEARRLACGARVLPAVLGGASLPLDLGRSARLFSEPQRTALGLAHATCAADGCERPFSWCELHHLRPWSHGGSTDLADAVPLCHFHHQRIHDHRYRHARSSAGSITFHLRV